MAGPKVCPLYTLVMNRETVCLGERCAWAISEDASTGKSTSPDSACCHRVIATQLRAVADELARLRRIQAPKA